MADHGYQIAGVKDVVLYYLAGYVHTKVAKTINYEKCQATPTAVLELLNCNGSQLLEDCLTVLTLFKAGCLCEPSLRQYTVNKKLEDIVCEGLDRHPVLGSSF